MRRCLPSASPGPEVSMGPSSLLRDLPRRPPHARSRRGRAGSRRPPAGPEKPAAQPACNPEPCVTAHWAPSSELRKRSSGASVPQRAVAAGRAAPGRIRPGLESIDQRPRVPLPSPELAIADHVQPPACTADCHVEQVRPLRRPRARPGPVRVAAENEDHHVGLPALHGVHRAHPSPGLWWERHEDVAIDFPRLCRHLPEGAQDPDLVRRNSLPGLSP
jgi:hypothetical protein